MKLIAFSLLVLLYFQSVGSTSEQVITSCTETGFRPEDEEYSEELASFNKELEEKTFNNILHHLNGCPKTECIVDPKGTAVWIARENLYKKFSIYSDHDETHHLDGCFCDSATYEELNNCLKKVREKMTSYLEYGFNLDLKEIIERDQCQKFGTNCKTK